MRVLDLFSGLGGWSAAFRDRSHRVTTLDLDPRFGADHVRDLMTVGDLADLGGPFDVVLASPPCECFSVMTIGKNWMGGPKGYIPKRPQTELALRLAWHTFDLIDRYRPTWYALENPRGMLRKVAPRPPDATTWYCRWGMPYAKPTDLWTNLNGGMGVGWPSCRPGGLDHEMAPRGADAGVQARRRPDGRKDTRYIRARLTRGERVIGYRLRKDGTLATAGTLALTTSNTRASERAMIPYRLSLAVALACENDGRLPAMDEVIAIEAARKAA